MHFSVALIDNSDFVSYLLLKNANINATNKLNQTPLHICCSKNRIENLKILLTRYDIDLNPIDVHGFTPLLKACSALAYKTASFLLQQENININKQDMLGNSCLHYCMEDGNVNLSLSLLKKGANYEIKNANNKTCLDLLKDNDCRSLILDFIEKKGTYN